MVVCELLETLAAQGVHLTAEGETLRYDGPVSVVTDAVLDELRFHKHALMELLGASPRRRAARATQPGEKHGGWTPTRGWPPRPSPHVWYRDRAGNVRECRDQWPMPGEIEYRIPGMIVPEWAEVPADWLHQPLPNNQKRRSDEEPNFAYYAQHGGTEDE